MSVTYYLIERNMAIISLILIVQTPMQLGKLLKILFYFYFIIYYNYKSVYKSHNHHN